MSKIVIANWKMYGNFEYTNDYLKTMCDAVFDTRLKLIVVPPFPYINLAYRQVVEHESEQIIIGAQNVAVGEGIRQTGELSAEMLVETGAKAVIIGHSERRSLGESDETINQKMKYVVDSELLPILCVGETKEEHDNVEKVLKNQITTALQGIKNLETLVIGYEPIWAIGNGETADNDEIHDIAHRIREIADGCCKIDNLFIVYGGSVNDKNIQEIINIDNIDGVFVGSYSLQMNEFCKTLEGLKIE